MCRFECVEEHSRLRHETDTLDNCKMKKYCSTSQKTSLKKEKKLPYSTYIWFQYKILTTNSTVSIYAFLYCGKRFHRFFHFSRSYFSFPLLRNFYNKTASRFQYALRRMLIDCFNHLLDPTANRIVFDIYETTKVT